MLARAVSDDSAVAHEDFTGPGSTSATKSTADIATSDAGSDGAAEVNRRNVAVAAATTGGLDLSRRLLSAGLIDTVLALLHNSGRASGNLDALAPAKPGSSSASSARAEGSSGGANEGIYDGQTDETGLPIGRKVELVRLVANMAYRCREVQVSSAFSEACAPLK